MKKTKKLGLNKTTIQDLQKKINGGEKPQSITAGSLKECCCSESIGDRCPIIIIFE